MDNADHADDDVPDHKYILITPINGEIVQFVNYRESMTMQAALNPSFSDYTETQDGIPSIKLLSGSMTSFTLKTIDKILSIQLNPPECGVFPAIRYLLRQMDGSDIMCIAIGADYLNIQYIPDIVIKCLADVTRPMSIRDMSNFFGTHSVPSTKLGKRSHE